MKLKICLTCANSESNCKCDNQRLSQEIEILRLSKTLKYILDEPANDNDYISLEEEK